MISCPEYIVALLEHLDSELDRIMGNITQEEYDSPFSNTGNEFKTDVFEVHAYYWGDDEDLIEKPNFKCGDIEIYWYKYLGRGTQINKKISPRKAVKIFNKCLLSLYQYEYDHDEDKQKYSQPCTLKEIKGFQRPRVSFFKRLILKWKYRHNDEES